MSFCSVADSTNYDPRFDYTIFGNCMKLRSKLCTIKSTGGPNPYFAPKTTQHAEHDFWV